MEINRERRTVRPETTNILKDPFRQIHRHNLTKTNSLPLRPLLKKGARNNRKISGIDDSVPTQDGTISCTFPIVLDGTAFITHPWLP